MFLSGPSRFFAVSPASASLSRVHRISLPKNRLSLSHASSFSSSLFLWSLPDRYTLIDPINFAHLCPQVNPEKSCTSRIFRDLQNCLAQKSHPPCFQWVPHTCHKNTRLAYLRTSLATAVPLLENGSVLISLLRYLIASLPRYLIPAPLCETRSSLSRGASQ